MAIACVATTALFTVRVKFAAAVSPLVSVTVTAYVVAVPAVVGVTVIDVCAETVAGRADHRLNPCKTIEAHLKLHFVDQAQRQHYAAAERPPLCLKLSLTRLQIGIHSLFLIRS